MDLPLTIRYNRSQLVTPLVISMALWFFGLCAYDMGFWRLPLFVVWMAGWTFIALAVIRNLVFPPLLLRISADGLSLGRDGILTRADIQHFSLMHRLITTGRRSRYEQTLTVSIQGHVPVTASRMWRQDRASAETCYFVETRYLDAPIAVVSEALQKAGVTMVAASNSEAANKP